MAKLILLNKPFNVLCQFTRPEADTRTLADYVALDAVYPAGRLDKDSEGLVILTDDGTIQHCISHPAHKLGKTYWVQVEGTPDETALEQLRRGVKLKDGITAPAKARQIAEPQIWPRTPPIRYRANIPTRWIELELQEGRNRQVRRMTAAVGFPTLRLIRYAVGNWTIDNLQPGQWKALTVTSEDICHDAGSKKSPAPPHRRRHHRKGRSVSHGRGNRQSTKGHQPTRRPLGKR